MAEIAAADGDVVKAGDLIVRLDDRTIRAAIQRDEAQIARDQAALTDAQATYGRTQSLVGSGNVAKQVGDDARAVLAEAEAVLDIDKAMLASDHVALANTEIRASFDGKLGALLVSVGAFAGPGTSVVSLTQMKPVLAEFSLVETSLDAARKDLAANNLIVTVKPVLAPVEQLAETGPIVFIDNAVDPASATFNLRAHLRTPWPLRSRRP